MRFLTIINKYATRYALILFLALSGSVASMPLASLAEPAHGIAMYGKPALPAGFTHLPYANPDAPKGGTICLAEPGDLIC